MVLSTFSSNLCMIQSNSVPTTLEPTTNTHTHERHILFYSNFTLFEIMFDKISFVLHVYQMVKGNS
ncbi:hypothetical protein BLOT_000194 [Blomia tropicalis]|nr:hypothetical protein BLOT_000194 [Blomia tropicalis]